MVRHEVAALALTALLADAACAGPPFEMDDPAPTTTRHWEIYLFTDAGGRGAEFEGTGGVDINYGIAPGAQITLTVPLRVSSEEAEVVGVGDVDLGVKYRFFNNARTGWSAAVSPRLTVPVIAGAGGSRRVSGELPVWIGKVSGDWAFFGGGGYAFNPGPEGRDGWFGGIVATRTLSSRITLGVEANRRDPDSVDGHGETRLVAGAVVQLVGPLALYLSGGPALIDHEPMRYSFFAALGATF